MIEGLLNYLSRRKRAYQLTFNTQQPADMETLADLSRFCRANESCVIPGDRDRSLVLEGRREVWLRIQQHLQLPVETLYQLYGGPATPKGEKVS